MFGASVAASTSLVVLVPLAWNTVQKKLKQYSDEDANDLNGVREHFLRYCGNSNLGNIELDFEAGGKVGIEDSLRSALTDKANGPVPIYLQYNSMDKLPELYVISAGQFVPCKSVDRWIRQLAKGHLADAIEESLGYICEYQRERNKRIFNDEFPYDPVNLFFEELKVWLLELSKISLHNKNILDNVNQRIKYLESVKTDQALFKPQRAAHLNIVNNAQMIRATLNDLISILTWKIKPVIQDVLSRLSAREHFDHLRLDIKYSIKSLFKYLFYILRNHAASPNFLLEELRKPSFSIYQKNAETVLDVLLSHLARSPGVVEVIPSVTAGLENRKLLSYGDFILLSDEKFSFPVLAKPFDKLQASDLLLKPSDDDHAKIGIHSIFRNKEHIAIILKLCSYIQKLCLAYNIANEFFDLSGEGGNLLVYRLAASELQPLMIQFNEFFTAIDHECDKLQQKADQHFNERFASHTDKKNLSKADEIWGEQFKYAKQAYDDLLQSLHDSQVVILEMQKSLQKVNSDDYLENIKRKIFHLRNLLQTFRELSPEPQLTSLSYPALSSSSSAASSSRLFFSLPPPSHKSILDNTSNSDPNLIIKSKHEERIKKEPDNPKLRIRYANFLLQLGGPENEKLVLEQVNYILERDNKNIEALYISAEIKKRQGEFLEAKTLLQKVFELKADHQEAVKLFAEVMDHLSSVDVASSSAISLLK